MKALDNVVSFKEESGFIDAVLSEDFPFTNWDGQEITLYAGMSIIVDVVNGWGKAGEFNISLENGDFQIVN